MSPEAWADVDMSVKMEDEPDFAKLATYLDALANPARLALLHQLREPRSAGEVRLKPSHEAGLDPDRNMTRPAVRKHLAKLRQAGLVAVSRALQGGTYSDYFVVNHQMVFALLEELRGVMMVSPRVAPPPSATMTGRQPRLTARAEGAQLILVRGAREGQVFRLEPRGLADGGGWLVGRRRGLAISLDYDPFVSQEHAEVLPKGDGFVLTDLGGKNGTEVNWEPLPRGGSAELATGDIVGVGRSLLVFRR